MVIFNVFKIALPVLELLTTSLTSHPEVGEFLHVINKRSFKVKNHSTLLNGTLVCWLLMAVIMIVERAN